MCNMAREFVPGPLVCATALDAEGRLSNLCGVLRGKVARGFPLRKCIGL